MSRDRIRPTTLPRHPATGYDPATVTVAGLFTYPLNVVDDQGRPRSFQVARRGAFYMKRLEGRWLLDDWSVQDTGDALLAR